MDELDHYLTEVNSTPSAYELHKKFNRHVSTVTSRLRVHGFKASPSGGWIKQRTPQQTIDHLYSLIETLTIRVTSLEGLVGNDESVRWDEEDDGDFD